MMLRGIPSSVTIALENGVPAIRALREATGESTEGFATITVIDLERMWALEAGEAPTADEIRTIAGAIGIDVDDLRPLVR